MNLYKVYMNTRQESSSRHLHTEQRAQSLSLRLSETDPDTGRQQLCFCHTAAQQQNLTCDNYCDTQRCNRVVKPGQLRHAEPAACADVCADLRVVKGAVTSAVEQGEL